MLVRNRIGQWLYPKLGLRGPKHIDWSIGLIRSRDKSRCFAVDWIKIGIAEHCTKEVCEIHERPKTLVVQQCREESAK